MKVERRKGRQRGEGKGGLRKEREGRGEEGKGEKRKEGREG